MKIATWNVNSVRARKSHLVGWLESEAPDVVCLQETKVVDEDFPIDEVRALGYEAELFGQRAYNGVALLTKGLTVVDVVRGFEDGDADDQARAITGTCGGVRVVGVYVPNGQSVGSDKFQYKIRWLGRLREFLDRQDDLPLVLCGDFNVAPDARDIYEPARLEGELLCTAAERKALKRVLDWGLVDAFREKYPDAELFSWWDYRGGAFRLNRGLRIDHMYANPPAMAACVDVRIHKEMRKQKTPSDHAPVVMTLEEFSH